MNGNRVLPVVVCGWLSDLLKYVYWSLEFLFVHIRTGHRRLMIYLAYLPRLVEWVPLECEKRAYDAIRV